MADKQITTTRNNYPAVYDVYGNSHKVVLNMEMPGVTKDHLDIKVDGDLMIIHGKKKTGAVKGQYRVREIRDCDYHHEFTIDDSIDRNKIDAAIKNGIVTITLALKESEKPRKINVVAK